MYSLQPCHSSVNQSQNLILIRCHCKILGQQRMSCYKHHWLWKTIVDVLNSVLSDQKIQKITRTSTNLFEFFLLNESLHWPTKTANSPTMKDEHTKLSFETGISEFKCSPVNLQETTSSNHRTTFQCKHKNTLTTNRHLAANSNYPALVALQSHHTAVSERLRFET